MHRRIYILAITGSVRQLRGLRVCYGVYVALTGRLPCPPGKSHVNPVVYIHYVRPSFTFSDSVGGIFLVQPVYQGIECLFFFSWRLQYMTVLSMLIRRITAVDWHIILSCYVTLFWLRVKFDIFQSWDCDDSPNYVSAPKRNCNVM